MQLSVKENGRYLSEVIDGKIISMQKVANDEIITTAHNIPALIADPAIVTNSIIPRIKAALKARA